MMMMMMMNFPLYQRNHRCLVAPLHFQSKSFSGHQYSITQLFLSGNDLFFVVCFYTSQKSD